GAEHACRHLPGGGTGDLVGTRPSGGAAIAPEGAARRIEPGNAGHPPVAARRSVAGDGEAGVAERASFLERARGLAVDALLARTRGPGDALPDQRAARRALDPEQNPVSPRLPAEAAGTGGRGRLNLTMRVAAVPIGLDPVDQLADLRIADRAFDTEVAWAEGGERASHLERQILAMAEQRAGGGPEPGEQSEPGVGLE